VIVEFFPMADTLREIRRELDAAFDRVVSRGQLILGPEVEAFEHEFATYCGARHCVTVGNGLDALSIALRARGIGPGDEVIVPGHTFIASWLAVSQVGAVPVGADVDPATFNLDPDSVRDAIGPRTAAIMPVHLYGNPAPMDELNALAARHGLFVLEDAGRRMSRATADAAPARSAMPPGSAFTRQRTWAPSATAAQSSPMTASSPSGHGATATMVRPANTSTIQPARTRGSTSCKRHSCAHGSRGSMMIMSDGRKLPPATASAWRGSPG
jgi:hypothetical protein